MRKKIMNKLLQLKSGRGSIYYFKSFNRIIRIHVAYVLII